MHTSSGHRFAVVTLLLVVTLLCGAFMPLPEAGTLGQSTLVPGLSVVQSPSGDAAIPAGHVRAPSPLRAVDTTGFAEIASSAPMTAPVAEHEVPRRSISSGLAPLPLRI